MCKKMVGRIVNYLLNRNIIKKDREIYEYSVEVFMI